MHSWLGGLSAELINKVDAFFRSFGYPSHYIAVTKLMNKSNYEHFPKISGVTSNCAPPRKPIFEGLRSPQRAYYLVRVAER